MQQKRPPLISSVYDPSNQWYQSHSSAYKITIIGNRFIPVISVYTLTVFGNEPRYIIIDIVLYINVLHCTEVGAGRDFVNEIFGLFPSLGAQCDIYLIYGALISLVLIFERVIHISSLILPTIWSYSALACLLS